MIHHPLTAKKRVDEALEVLRIGLTPYVSLRMEHAFGSKWRTRASRAAGDEDDDFVLDAYALLKTVLDNWREVFSVEAKLRKAHSYIFLARDARNKMAHFVGTIEQREALRYLDTILEVLRAIGKSNSWRAIGVVDTTSLARLTHIERFYCLLDRLCQRVGGSRSLGNLGGFHDWPRAAFISFLNPQRAAPTAEAALGSSASAHMRSVRGRAQLFASDLGSIAEP